MLKLSELTLEQKIGLVLCSRRCHEQEDLDTTVEMIHNHAVGCVQVRIDENTKSLIDKLKAEADYPILYINDMERGYPTSRLPKLPAMCLAACNNEQYYRDFAEAIVAEAQADGIVGTWGPIVDILTCDAPCSVSREFGSTPEAVVQATEVIQKVFAEHHFLGCGKHYGGKTNPPVDTHMVEGANDRSEEYFRSHDLVPYIELMKKGLLPSVMTSHTVHTQIDPDYPATLSKKMIDIIRSEGFDGVIFTDSLAMMGILQKYGEGHAMALALAAGCDIILPNYRTPHKLCVQMMTEEFEKGTFTEERLNEAVRRIIAAMEYVSAPAPKAEVTEAVRASYYAVARDCITAVTDEGVSAALPEPDKKRLFIVMKDQEQNDSEISQEIFSGGWYSSKTVAEAIKAEFPNAELAYTREYPTAAENERLLTKATHFDSIVFCTFCVTSAYLGTDCLTRRAEALVNALIDSGKMEAVVHFGNPYAVERLHHVPRLVFAYCATESHEYAIKVLRGESEARGRLPFNVNVPR